MWEPQSQNGYAYVENNPINWIDPSGHRKASDSDYLADLIQSYTDGYERLDERESNLKACVVDTVCRANQSSIEEIQNMKSGLEEIADGVRVAYYNLHGQALPSDITHRYFAANVPDYTDKLNGIMTSYGEKYKDYASTHNVVDTAKKFVDLVRSGGELDLKTKQPFKSSYHFIYSGEMYRKDDSGNISFGYIGKVFGYSDDFLLKGAGGYQLLVTHTSQVSWYSSNFDDPRDQLMINRGISIYNSQH